MNAGAQPPPADPCLRLALLGARLLDAALLFLTREVAPDGHVVVTGVGLPSSLAAGNPIRPGDAWHARLDGDAPAGGGSGIGTNDVQWLVEPLAEARGTRIGCLCVALRPGARLDAAGRATLSDLAALAVPLVAGGADQQDRDRIRDRLRFKAQLLARISDAVMVSETRSEPGSELRIVYVNEAFTTMTGYRAVEILGGTPRLLQGPDTDPAAVGRIRAALAECRQERVELVNYRKDGSRFDAEIEITPLLDEHGACTHVVSVHRDITGRAHIQRALRESEARFRQLSEAAPLGIFFTDERGGGLYTNAYWCRLTGQTREQALASGWSAAIHPDDRDRVMQSWIANAAAGGEWRAEFRVRGADGTARWVEARSAPVLRDGGVSGHVGTVLDITDRRGAEDHIQELNRALRGRLEELQTVLDVVPVAIGIAHDREAREITMNGPGAAMLGIPADFNASKSGTTGSRLPFRLYSDGREVAPDELPMQRAVRLRATVRDVELDMVREDGTVTTLLDYASPLFDESGEVRGAVGVFVDITARKRAEQALRLADRHKDEFLAMLAHELRNPLAPIRNAVHILRALNPGDARLASVHDMIGRQVEHLAHLVDDLLDVARVTQGKITLQLDLLELGQLVRAAAEAHAPLIAERRHHLDLDLGTTPVHIRGDATRLAQVIGNVLNNAVKYTPPGGAIQVHLDRQDGEARLCIADNGAGIGPELLPHVFDLFSQATRTLDRSQGGLGIGLALVKNLVALHGGTVEARSEGPGKGATFEIRLPLQDGHAPGHAAPGAAATRPPVNASRRRILLVDDHRDALDSLADVLRMAGHEVAIAMSGTEALILAPTFRPDVALLDIGLPGMDGYESARQLRLMPAGRDVLLIALTGYGHDKDLERSRAAGFSRHLVKPIDVTELLELLDRR